MNIPVPANLHHFWRRLAPREQRALRVLALVLALLLCYLAIWAPLQRSLARLRTDVPRQASELAVMRAQAALVEELRRQPAPAAPVGGLSGLVERSSAAHGLRPALTRVDVEGANGVRVQVDGASFTGLLVWLAELQQQNAVRIESATFDAHTTVGSVSARLLLRGPGG